MTQRGSFDAMLSDWLEAEAAGMAPTGLHDGAMRAARVVRQRPGWLVGIRGGGFSDQTAARPLVTRRHLLVAVALVILAALIAIGAGWRPDLSLLGVENGRIMFARERTGQLAEYVTVRPDGTDAVRFMEANDCGQCAFWSPDGRLIMIPRVVAGDRLATAVIRPDGTTEFVVPVEDETLFLGPSDWSRDGRLMAFEGFDPNNPTRPEVGVYVANADGSGLRQVTSSGDGRFHGFPTFSPDGRRIAFLQEDTGSIPIGGLHGDLFIVNTDGSDLRQVSPAGTKAVVAGPTGRPMAWSPDGRQLVFTVVEGLQTGRSAVYLVDIEGGEPRRISEFGSWLVSVAWSPDGRWILYGEVAAPNAPTWIARPDGADPLLLTGPGAAISGCCATWAPDSSRLLIRRVGGADSDLWTMDLTGNALDQITHQEAGYIWYSWAREP